MKQGLNFQQVVERVEREATVKHDFFAPTDVMHLSSDDSGSHLATPAGVFPLRDTAHLHLAELAGIDRRYYTRMRQQAPELLDQNVNFWLGHNRPQQRLIRTLDQEARAVVSPRFATFDNDQLLRTLEPVMENLEAYCASGEMTDERLVLKIVSPRVSGQVRVGDYVEAGLVVHNSEVRAGALSIQWFVHRLVCTNGMVVSDSLSQVKRRHFGRLWADEEGHLSEPAERAAWYARQWAAMQEEISAQFQAAAFQPILERFQQAASLRSDLPTEAMIARIADRFALSEAEAMQVALHFEAEGDRSLWGIANAVTRTAQEADSYARATTLEELGGILTHLTPRQWEQLVRPN